MAPATATAAGPPPATPEPIAAKRLDCQAGQVDVNSASAEQLMRDLGLSLPVAQRLIAHREPLFLDLDDLLTVEGIGPDRLAEIKRQGVACTDLPVSPPPTDAYVCRPGDGRIDVNRPSSSDRLVALFGKPTAQRIVAGMPYAGVKPMIAEHVPGVGSGKQTNLLAQLCATPPTIDHGSTRWGWISTAGGRVEHPDEATLTIGPGVIDDPAGMWGSVHPVPHDPIEGGPKFDLTVHGPWKDGGDVAYVTLPRDGFAPPAAPDAWTATLLHYTGGDDADVHALDGVYVGPDGRWTTALRSLSLVQSILQPLVSLPSAGFSALSRSALAKLISNSILGTGYAPPGCGALSDDDRLRVSVFPQSLETGLLGGFIRPSARWCADGDASSGAVRFRLSNMGMPTFGFDQAAGPADTLGVSVSSDVSLLTGLLLRFYNRGIKPGADSSGVVYGPGVTVDFKLPASDQAQEVDLERNAEHPGNIIYDTLFIATEHLGNVPGLETPGAVIDCIENVPAPDLASIIGCVEGIAQHVAGDAAATAKLAAIDRALNALSLIRSGSEYLALAIQGGSTGINGTVTFRLKKPVVAAPGQPGDGNPATATGTRILKRTGSTAAYVLDENGVAHHIPDGGTYICNAQHYLVQFNVDDAEWAAQVRSVGTDATCPTGQPRGLGPSTVPAGVLLRLEEEGDMFLTSTWNGESRLVPVFGGQEIFDCMVEKYLVWDWVTYDEYDNFRHHPIEAGVGCGVILQP